MPATNAFCLFLNIFQSLALKNPFVVKLACGIEYAPVLLLNTNGAVALKAPLARASVKYLLLAPSLISFVVKLTLGPAKPLTLVTEFGVANSIQLAKFDDGFTLST